MTEQKRVEAALIVRSTGEMRVVKGTTNYMGKVTGVNSLRYDEVWFRISVTLPANWGHKVGEIELEVPEGAVEIEGEWGGAKHDPLEELLVDADGKPLTEEALAEFREMEVL